MARELERGRKLARHRGSFLQGQTGSTRARREGLSGGVLNERDLEHAARQAYGRARLGLQAAGRAFTRLARHAWSKARARASASLPGKPRLGWLRRRLWSRPLAGG